MSILSDIGKVAETLLARADKSSTIHGEASAAIRKAVTETRIYGGDATKAGKTDRTRESDLARLWSDASAKAQAHARQSHSDEIRQIADDCMTLADRFAQGDVTVEDAGKSTTRVFENAKSVDYAQSSAPPPRLDIGIRY